MRCKTRASKPEPPQQAETGYAFEPATLSALSVGDIVYCDAMWRVMVAGTSNGDGRVAIREAGFNKKDRLVSVSKIQRVR